MMPLGILVAFDDFLLGHLGKRVSVAHALHILDGLAGGLMDLAEADRLLGRNSGDEPDRDQD
jgi:hypothetical protein